MALTVSILTRSTPEMAFDKLNNSASSKQFINNKSITSADIEIMIKMRAEGMKWDEVGEAFGLDTHAAFKRVKRYKERRKKDEK